MVGRLPGDPVSSPKPRKTGSLAAAFNDSSQKIYSKEKLPLNKNLRLNNDFFDKSNELQSQKFLPPIFMPDEQAHIAALEATQVKPVTRPAPVPPLPSPLPIISGFYLDDEQIAWELFRTPFEQPRSMCFSVALPCETDPLKYDIAEFKIPLRQDADGMLIFDSSRFISSNKTHDDTSRQTALLQTAAFANAAIPDFANRTGRELPRIPDTDVAFHSFLRSIDFRISKNYKLSDTASFRRIEDVIDHPSLRQDVPEVLKSSDAIDLDTATPGVHHTKLTTQPKCRSKEETSPYRFRPMTVQRDVTLDDFVPSVPPAMPDLPTVMIEKAKKPSLLMFAFDRNNYRHHDLLNEFAWKLSYFGLRIVAHKPYFKNPLQGKMTIANQQGQEFTFCTSIYYSDKDAPPGQKFVTFKIKGLQDLSFGNFDITIDCHAEDFRKGSWKNGYEDGIHPALEAFGLEMAKTTAEIFEKQTAFCDLQIPSILKSAYKTRYATGKIPAIEDGMILYGPLEGAATWADINQKLEDHNVKYGKTPANLNNLFQAAKLESYDSPSDWRFHFTPTSGIERAAPTTVNDKLSL